MADKGNGAKAFGGLMAVVALAGVMGILWKPLADRVENVEAAVSVHVGKRDHPILQTEQILALRRELELAVQRVDALEERDWEDKDVNARFRLVERAVLRWMDESDKAPE
jgi:hypothetical protein